MVADLVQGSYNTIVQEIGQLNDLSESLRGSFEQYATELAQMEIPALTPAPTYADPGAGIDANPNFDAPPTAPPEPQQSFDAPQAPSERDVDGIIAGVNTNIDEFAPSISEFVFPQVPVQGNYPVPAPPTLATVAFPTEPALDQPTLDTLVPITIPAFTPVTLPTFDITAPELSATAPASVLAWDEPEYKSEMLDQVNGKIVEMMSGKSGLPEAVEQALFDRARSREDTLALKARDEAFETFAAKGYSMPPGVLVEQVNAVIEDNQLKAQGLSRDVYIKAQETLIQQLNFAIQQCVALETLQINLFNNVMQRKLEIEKARIEQAIAIFNAEVQAFNIRSQAYGVAAQVFKVRVDAELAKLEQFKAQIEAQKAIGQLNQQFVEIYKARLGALETAADVYKTRVQAATARLDADKARIDIFRAQIEAYAAQVSTDKSRIDAYRAQVEAEAAKVGIVNAEANVYMAQLKAKEVHSSLSLRKIDAILNAAQNDTQRFIALIEAEKAKVTSDAQIFATKSDNYRALLQKFTAEASTKAAYAELNVKRVEGAIRNAIALYQAEISKYQAEADRAIKLGDLNRESLRMMAQYSSQLAAGAMSARHLSMGFSGSVSNSITRSG